jgi:hypothetical protein
MPYASYDIQHNYRPSKNDVHLHAH